VSLRISGIEAFYQKARARTGLDIPQMRQVLIENFGTTYTPSRENEYMEFLCAYAQDIITRKELEEREQRKERKLQLEIKQWHVDAKRCPIPTCDGFQKFHPVWKWVCSIGGIRHHLAFVACKFADMSPEEFLAGVDKISEEREKEVAQELAFWRNGIYENQEVAN